MPYDYGNSVDPALLEAFGLDPDVLHLNHGAFGVAPVVVRRAAAAWRDRAERNPHRFNRVEIAPVHFDGVGYLRIAAAPYNTPDDYDRLADTVRELLDRHA